MNLTSPCLICPSSTSFSVVWVCRIDDIPAVPPITSDSRRMFDIFTSSRSTELLVLPFSTWLLVKLSCKWPPFLFLATISFIWRSASRNGLVTVKSEIIAYKTLQLQLYSKAVKFGCIKTVCFLHLKMFSMWNSPQVCYA